VSKPLSERIPFAKIVTVLSIAFGVSLGLCGVTAVFAIGVGGGNGFSGILGMLELIVMALSAIGLLITGAVLVTLSAIGSFNEKVSQPQKLFESEDDTKIGRND
jgi:hypothetical protein